MSTVSAARGQLSLEVIRGVLVVEVQGPSLTQETLLEEFYERVVANLPQAETAVLIDCQSLSGRVTSSFLAMLVSIRRQASEAGLLLCVCNLRGPVREAYQMCCLGRIIPLYESREAALRYVGELGQPADVASNSTPARPPAAPGSSLSESLPTAASAVGQMTALVGGLREQATRLRMPSAKSLLIAGAAAAGLLLTGGVWLLVTSSQRPNRDHVSTDNAPPAFGGETGEMLTGELLITAGQARYPDANAMVLAWRADDPPKSKVHANTIYRYLNSAGGPFPQASVYAGRASQTGKFNLRLGTPGTYRVLIISSAVQRGRSLASEDETKLAEVLEGPKELVGEHLYRLRDAIVTDAPAVVRETFERSTATP